MLYPLLSGTHLWFLSWPDMHLMTMALPDKWWHSAFLATGGSHKLARTAMGLIILQLHGHAPYGNITVSLLCVVLRGRQDPGAACRLPLWAFYGQLEWCTDEKWRSLQAPLFLSDFALGNRIYYIFFMSCNPHWFLPISMLIWENVSIFFQDTKQPVNSRYYFVQTVLYCYFVELKSSKHASVFAVFDLIYLKDVLKWNVCIPPVPSS